MIITCNKCGAECDVTLSEGTVEWFRQNNQPIPWLCENCFEHHEVDAEARREAEFLAEQEDRLDEAVIESGVRPDYAVRKPYVKYVADWLSAHRCQNILLSGETGTGKSTSAGYIIRGLIRNGATVHVYYMAELLDLWREVRCTNDNPKSIKALFAEIESRDFLVIDECAGKTVNTDSTREFMFRLLEDVASGSCKATVWLLGNFYTGSIKDVFGDEAPSMRRIREKFVCGRIDCTNSRVVPIFKAR